MRLEACRSPDASPAIMKSFRGFKGSRGSKGGYAMRMILARR